MEPLPSRKEYLAETSSFPHAVIHVDGDSFFAACELARRPDLWGRPVVTGSERGIATAISREAKARGIVRGMRISDMHRICPDLVILASDYDMYRLYARRMYEIVRRYAEVVEEYSIDECFALLRPSFAKGFGGQAAPSYEDVARAIQKDLHDSLGITFSLGLSVNKCLAKAASKRNKPAGFTVVPREGIREFLKDIGIGSVWGIGSSTTLKLRKLGIATALDFASKGRDWVDEHCDKPLREIYEEFQGHFVKELGGGSGSWGGAPRDSDFASIQHTRTFRPDSNDRNFLWSQLSLHVEEACARLRDHGRRASRIYFFLKTRDFDYLRAEAELPEPLAAPEEILRAMRPHFDRMFRKDLRYRASGIGLSGITHADGGTGRLFELPSRAPTLHTIHEQIDRLVRKFGGHPVFLASGLRALKKERDDDGVTSRGPARMDHKKFNLIWLGQVR